MYSYAVDLHHGIGKAVIHITATKATMQRLFQLILLTRLNISGPVEMRELKQLVQHLV